jgi:thioredoxin-related protein
MKFIRQIILLIIAGLFFSCGNNSSVPSTSKSVDDLREQMEADRVEVMFFHNHERCSTCLNMEKLTKEVVDIYFGQQVKDGRLVMMIIDIEDKNNAEVTDDYQVIWTSLYINKWQNGTESRHNMTEFAFLNVDSDPEAFKEGLRKQIEVLL